MTQATFVLSTGRCGTQWLAHVLGLLAGDAAVVTHEPLENDYAPRRMLGAGDPSRLDEETAEVILEHVSFIETVLETRSYVECGHPVWSSLPYLIQRFRGRMRIIHLVRHPVPTAWSWVAQQAYCPPLTPFLPEKVLLSAFDDGVRLDSFREKWDRLGPYEKALFYWAEVNALGLRMEREDPVPFLRVRFEDLFRSDTVARVLAFAGVGSASTPEVDGSRPVDEYPCVVTVDSDPRSIERHPEVIAVAAALGYDVLQFDDARLRRSPGHGS